MYRPELAVFINSLHPIGALYEVPLNPDDAKVQMQALIDYFTSKGIKTVELFDILQRHDTP